ncbi:MAG: YbbR-like domain-containing protein [Sphingobacteriaceae bacterium]|nr:YbbR-like domain-containing protein [Sphingobacteriaceae bacterium]
MNNLSKNIFNFKKPGKTTAFFLCLLAATFLWFLKSLNTYYIYNINIPVVFKNLPSDRKPLSHIPDELNIEIKASGLKLFFILLNKPFKTLELDLKKVNSRNSNIPIAINTSNLKKILKFEATVRHINPDTLYFASYNTKKRNVPIKFSGKIDCKQGFGYHLEQLNPAFVSISGDSLSVYNTDTIFTQYYNITNLNSSFQKELKLQTPAGNLFMSANTVTIECKVEKLIEHNLKLEVIPDQLPEGLKAEYLFPKFINVKFTSLQNQFDLADTSLFTARVNASELKNKKGYVYLSRQPKNVSILQIKPENVEIILLKK